MASDISHHRTSLYSLAILCIVGVGLIGYCILSYTAAIASQTLVATDTFQRTNQSLWGTASDGSVWGADASSNTVFSISGNQAVVTNPSAILSGTLGPSMSDGQVLATGQISSFSGGDYGVILRYTDANNWYKAYIDGTNLVLRKMVAGTNSVVAQTSFPATATTAYAIRFQILGDVLDAKAWAANASEPASWMIATTDTSLLSPGRAGVQAYGTDTVTYSSFSAYQFSGATSGTIAVNYNNQLRTLDPLAIGMDISGYYTPNDFATDALEQARLATLGPTYYRLNLQYTTSGDPTSKIICSSSGGDTGPTGDQWVTSVKNNGGTPVIVVPFTTATDAANMVKHFNKDTNNSVKYWIIGNEPDLHSMSAATYSGDFNQDYDAMKAIDPTILVGGGVTSAYESTYLQSFLQASGSRTDFVDYHGYPQQGVTPGDPGYLFQYAQAFQTQLVNLQSIIQSTVPARASSIFMEVGEYELNWGGSAQDDTNFHALWTASTLGNILKGGGRAMFFADKGNLLYGSSQTITDEFGHNVMVSLDDTNPAYHGIGMFTGEKLFPHFGSTLVQATASSPDIEVFASDQGKNVVVINEDPLDAQTETFTFTGFTSGTADVWQKNESLSFPSPPAHLSAATIINGTMTYQLPAYSITTFILTPAGASSSPSPSPSSTSNSSNTGATHTPATSHATSISVSSTPEATTNTTISTLLELHITVRDAKGDPIPGVAVTLHSNVESAVTDQDGIAIFHNVSPGVHTLHIDDKGYYASQSITVRPTAGSSGTLLYTLTVGTRLPASRVTNLHTWLIRAGVTTGCLIVCGIGGLIWYKKLHKKFSPLADTGTPPTPPAPPSIYIG